MTISATTWVRSLLDEVPSTRGVFADYGVDLSRDESLDSTLYELAERLGLDLGALSRSLRAQTREQER